jgi:hypothetical protein
MNVDMVRYCVEGCENGDGDFCLFAHERRFCSFSQDLRSERLAYGCLRSLLYYELVFGLLWLMVLEYIHDYSFHVLCVYCCDRYSMSLIRKFVQGIDFADFYVC